MRTKVVGADFEGFLLAHKQPDLPSVLALQQPDLANAALLPLARIVIKAVQLALTADRCNACSKRPSGNTNTQAISRKTVASNHCMSEVVRLGQNDRCAILECQ